MFKKLLLGAFGSMLMLGSFNAFTSAQVDTNQGNFWDVEKTEDVWVAVAWQDKEEGLIGVIKGFINWVLWILGLIALIILLWGGFQMVIAAWDEEKFNNGFKILKQAGIGLALIWVSWFIVSLIFSVIWSIAGWQ